MPTAICETCKKTSYWRNRRGAKLADMKCECGGKLARAEYDSSSGSWIKRKPADRKYTDQKFVKCAVCGRKILFPSQSSHMIEGTASYEWQLQKITLAPGAIICWGHAPLLSNAECGGIE